MARSLKKNFVYQASYQLLLIITPLITTPYLSRVLGADGVGVFSYTHAITSYFVMFATLGMSSYGVRLIASCGDDREKRSKAFFSAYASQVLTGLVSLTCYIVYALYFPQSETLLIAIWSLWVFAALIDVTWLLFGVEEFRVPTIRSIITKVASLAIILIFVKGKEDIWIYIFAISGSFFLNQIMVWPFVCRYVDFQIPPFKDVVSHLLPNLRLFVPVIAVSLYTSMDKILLGAIAGETQVGFFEYSEKLSKIPLALITAMTTVMLPRMSSSIAQGNRARALRQLDNSIWAMLSLAFAFCFGIIAISPEFAPIFLGTEFSECDKMMSVLALTIPLISVSSVLGKQYLLPALRDGEYTASLCSGAIVNLLVAIIFIPRYGAMGAVLATVSAELIVSLVQIIIVKKELPVGRYLKNSISFLLSGFGMLLVVRFSSPYICSIFGRTMFTILFEVLIGAFSYLVFALCLCMLVKDQHLSLINKR